MGMRTRSALESIGLKDNTHRSRQLDEKIARESDLIVAMATEHVAYVRRTHPEVAHKTITLKRLARDLPIPTDPAPTDPDPADPAPAEPAQLLAASLAQLQPEFVALQDWESIDDPGSGELDYFMASLHEISPLVDEFLSKTTQLFSHQPSGR